VRAAAWLRARAENVAALLFAAMFLAFMLQIFSRYVLQDPYGWTVEASLIAWLWIVFWGSGLLIENREHVRFDLLYAWSGRRTRRVFALISVVAIALSFAASLPATIDFVAFMRVERSGTLGIRLDLVFSVYVVFAAAVIARYAVHAIRILRGADPDSVLGVDSAR
jgi:TRAP-type C4-dicarboxylate transport system permease small subunit